MKEENKTLKITAPEGYEIDKENSTFEKIVFKPAERWRDNIKVKCNGWHVSSNGGNIVKLKGICPTADNGNMFYATEKQAKSAAAMARISMIMEHDKRFGGPITDEEWCNPDVLKFIIYRAYSTIKTSNSNLYSDYHFLAFHSATQRDLFLKENEDLVKQYLMVDDD